MKVPQTLQVGFGKAAQGLEPPVQGYLWRTHILFSGKGKEPFNHILKQIGSRDVIRDKQAGQGVPTVPISGNGSDYDDVAVFVRAKRGAAADAGDCDSINEVAVVAEVTHGTREKTAPSPPFNKMGIAEPSNGNSSPNE